MRFLPWVLLLLACPGPPTVDPADTGVPDTDVADSDTDVADSDTDVDPAGPVDLFASGPWDCDMLSVPSLTDDQPGFVVRDFTVAGKPADALLSAGGKEILADGNLGGSSLNSEILAMEALFRCDGATLVYTEGEVPYEDPGGKKTDLVVTLDGVRLGVSVTRAVGFPPDDPWPVEKARDILDKKLDQIVLSSENVVDAEGWPKQLLFVAAYSPEHAENLKIAWDSLDAPTRADSVVVVAVTFGDDEYIYFGD